KTPPPEVTELADILGLGRATLFVAGSFGFPLPDRAQTCIRACLPLVVHASCMLSACGACILPASGGWQDARPPITASMPESPATACGLGGAEQRPRANPPSHPPSTPRTARR